MDPSSLLPALGAATPATLLAAAVIYLYRDNRRISDARLEDHKQILPLATKLVSCVELVERLTTASIARGGG